MKTLRRTVLVVMALAMVFALAACNKSNDAPAAPSASSAPAASQAPSAAPAEKITIRIGATGARGHMVTEWMYHFADAVHAKSDKFIVEPYPAGQFGTAAEMVEAVMENNLQGVCVPTGYLAAYCPFVNILDVPFLFPPGDAWFDILNAGIPTIIEAFREVGVYPVSWPYISNQWVDSTVPIKSVADLKGLNTRGMNSDVWLEVYGAMGCNPVVMPTSDLPMALQQGTIDAHFGPFSIAHSMLLGIIEYFIAIPDMPMCDCIMMSDKFLQSLSAEDRDFILKTADEVTRGANKEYSITMTDEYLKDFEEYGIEVTYMNPTIEADLKALLLPIKENFPNKYPDLADAFYEICAIMDAHS